MELALEFWVAFDGFFEYPNWSVGRGVGLLGQNGEAAIALIAGESSCRINEQNFPERQLLPEFE